MFCSVLIPLHAMQQLRFVVKGGVFNVLNPPSVTQLPCQSVCLRFRNVKPAKLTLTAILGNSAIQTPLLAFLA